MTTRTVPSRLLSPGLIVLLAASMTLGASAAGTGGTLLAQEPPPAPPEPGAGAQEEPPGEVTLVLEDGQRPLLRLAFPEIDRGELSQPAQESADVLEETLRNDLDASRVFEIQGPWAFTVLELTGERTQDMDLYRSLGNEVLLEAVVEDQDGKILFEGRVFDLASGDLVLGKRYRGDYEVARRVAHTFADEVILFFTGKRGLGLTTIAFHSDRTGDKEIYLMDYDGANERQITAHRSVSLFPAWSSDDSTVAYVSFLDGSPGIYQANLSTGRKQALVTGGALNTSPAFSPDGRQMAFGRSLDGNTELFVADGDGSNPRRLTFTGAIDTNPAWSPTGNEIAFTSSRSGRPDIWVVDPEGTNTQRISTGGNYNDGAAWSPDGTRLAYASRREGVFQIVVTDRVSLETVVLTSGSGDKESPSFSPDGRKIVYSLAFSGSSGKETQIWVMDADGRNPRQLTSEGNSYSPAWSGYRE